MSLPFEAVVSTCPVPGCPSGEQELYIQIGTHSSHLPPCSPSWRALLCHMGSENTDRPSSEWLTKPKQSVILPVFMAIRDIMYRQCSTDSFAFVALPEQSMLSMSWIQEYYLCVWGLVQESFHEYVSWWSTVPYPKAFCSSFHILLWCLSLSVQHKAEVLRAALRKIPCLSQYLGRFYWEQCRK